MMGMFVLNEVEGKEASTINMVYFHPSSQYSSIPLFHGCGIKQELLKDF